MATVQANNIYVIKVIYTSQCDGEQTNVELYNMLVWDLCACKLIDNFIVLDFLQYHASTVNITQCI